MTIFTILGVVWTALMGARIPTLRRECKIFVRVFQTSAKYTKTQARWVTFRHVFLPGILMAPALVFLERAAFYDPPSVDEIYQTARHIDVVLKSRAGLTAEEEQ